MPPFGKALVEALAGPTPVNRRGQRVPEPRGGLGDLVYHPQAPRGGGLRRLPPVAPLMQGFSSGAERNPNRTLRFPAEDDSGSRMQMIAQMLMSRSAPGQAAASPDSVAEALSGTSVANAIPGSPVPGQSPHAATHETSGLAGYPAYDYMAPAGTVTVAPATGRIMRLSGKDPSLGGSPGGPLGYSIYLQGGGHNYFLTHLDKLRVKAGQRVRQGQQIAEVAAGPASWSSPHVHMGVRG